MSKKSTNKQRIKSLESEVKELRIALISLKKFIGQQEEEYVSVVTLKIDPNENQRFIDQLRATELEFTRKAS